MADRVNRQVERFNSRMFDPEAEAVNCFSQDWAGENNWAVPPFSLIGRVLQHVAECAAWATVVVPEWPAQEWWPLLMSLTVDRLMLSEGRAAFQPGRSGFVEPWKNVSWQMWAVRVKGSGGSWCRGGTS
jgi:hypothetical protein